MSVAVCCFLFTDVNPECFQRKRVDTAVVNHEHTSLRHLGSALLEVCLSRVQSQLLLRGILCFLKDAVFRIYLHC